MILGFPLRVPPCISGGDLTEIQLNPADISETASHFKRIKIANLELRTSSACLVYGVSEEDDRKKLG